jgi:hypothetical protein
VANTEQQVIQTANLLFTGTNLKARYVHFTAVSGELILRDYVGEDNRKGKSPRPDLSTLGDVISVIIGEPLDVLIAKYSNDQLGLTRAIYFAAKQKNILIIR